MKKILAPRIRKFCPPLVAFVISITCLTASAQLAGEGIRFKHYEASGWAILPGEPAGVGTANYTFDYGSNAIYKATISNWYSFANDCWILTPDPDTNILWSVEGTNRWTIDAAGALTADSSVWRLLTNSVQASTWSDNVPYFPALENRMAKGYIPALQLTNVDCKLELVILGDRPDFTNDVIVQFTITATDADTQLPIPDADISVSGASVTNGIAWQVFKEWTTRDVTPVIANHPNYTFTLEKLIVRPQIMLNGQPVSGLSVSNWFWEATGGQSPKSIYVGERIYMWLNLGEWTVDATNFQWAIPGPKIINFIELSDTGGPVWFQPGDGTNFTVACFMVDGFTNDNVNVTATLNGLTVNTRFKLSVNQIPVDFRYGGTNEIGIHECYAGYPFGLYFGFNDPNWGGINFRAVANDSATNGVYFFTQKLLSFTHEFHYYTNLTNVVKMYRESTNALLDDPFLNSYVNVFSAGPPPETRFWDSPGVFGATSNDFRLVADMSFATYLMWKSNRPGSQPITRWKALWLFNAEAVNFSAPESDWLVTLAIGSLLLDFESAELPSWDNCYNAYCDITPFRPR